MFESLEAVVSWIILWASSGKAYEIGISIARGLVILFFCILVFACLFIFAIHKSRDNGLPS